MILKIAFLSLISLITFSVTALGQQDSAQEFSEGLNELNREALERHDQKREYMSNVQVLNLGEADLSQFELYTSIDDSRPVADSIFKVYMGDRMLQQRTGYVASCIVPSERIVKDAFGGRRFWLEAGVPVCKQTPDAKVYTPTYENVEGHILDISIREKKDRVDICWHMLTMGKECLKKLKPEILEIGRAFLSVENSTQRVIEYAGIQNGIVKFIYSEYMEGQSREALSREFSVDLGEGTTAAYKGAVFEIIDANNAEITYKVIRHFQ